MSDLDGQQREALRSVAACGMCGTCQEIARAALTVRGEAGKGAIPPIRLTDEQVAKLRQSELEARRDPTKGCEHDNTLMQGECDCEPDEQTLVAREANEPSDSASLKPKVDTERPDADEDHSVEPCGMCGHRRGKHGGPVGIGFPCAVDGCDCARYVVRGAEQEQDDE